MIIDSLLEVSVDQALTATGPSTKVLDFGLAGDGAPNSFAQQLGVGQPLWMQFAVGAGGADKANGDETYEFELETSVDQAFTVPISLGRIAISRDDLAEGTRFQIAIPISGMKQYVRAKYTLGGTTPSITISAWISDQHLPAHKHYPNAI